MNHKYSSNTEEDTEKIAIEFAKCLRAGDIVLLEGELGAGKSTFVRGIAKELGVTSRVLSPTFSLIRTHSTSHPNIRKLHHVDLYRAEDNDITIEQLLKEFQSEKNAVMVVEWPNDEVRQKCTWVVKIEKKDNSRMFTFTADGQIQKGEVIIFPTDTAFGIGCRIDDRASIKRVFEIRKRPKDKAVPILISSLNMAKKYGDFDKSAEYLAQKFWPGGLTIVVKAKKDMVPALARGGGDTVGLRIPDHVIAQKIIEAAGVPILGPSANFAGENTPYTMEDIQKDLQEMVDRVIPGKTKRKTASTVIDTTTSPWKIVREGAIPSKDIEECIPST